MPQWRNRLQKHKGPPKKKTLAGMIASGSVCATSQATGMILPHNLRKRWEFRNSEGEPEFYWCLATGDNGVIYNMYGQVRLRVGPGYQSCVLGDYPDPPDCNLPLSLTPAVVMDFRANVDLLLESGFLDGSGQLF